MTCNYKDPDMRRAAQNERRQRILNAPDEDAQLAAAESVWEEYVPMCECPECVHERQRDYEFP